MAESETEKAELEARAALDARDRRLLGGLLGRDVAITREAVEKVLECAHALAKRHARWLLRDGRWRDFSADLVVLLLRWRDEGHLRAVGKWW